MPACRGGCAADVGDGESLVDHAVPGDAGVVAEVDERVADGGGEEHKDDGEEKDGEKENAKRTLQKICFHGRENYSTPTGEGREEKT